MSEGNGALDIRVDATSTNDERVSEFLCNLTHVGRRPSKKMSS